MKELEIVLEFRTKEITLDEISLPMRVIKHLRTRAAMTRPGLSIIAFIKACPKNCRACWWLHNASLKS
jgi:hypothetical protein